MLSPHHVPTLRRAHKSPSADVGGAAAKCRALAAAPDTQTVFRCVADPRGAFIVTTREGPWGWSTVPIPRQALVYRTGAEFKPVLSGGLNAA